MRSVLKYITRKSVVGGLVFCTLLPHLSGCGAGTVAKDTNTPAEIAGETPAPTPEASPEAPVSFAAAPVATAGPVCIVKANDEESSIVISDSGDWFLTVSPDTKVDCENDRGIADMDMSGLHISVVTQSLSDSLTLDKAVEAFIQDYTNGVSQSIAFETPLSFEKKLIGEYNRPSWFSDGRFVEDSQGYHLVTSVTASVNTNKQAIFHVVFWKLEESDFAENNKTALDTLEAVSASWFRLSDIDDGGNLSNLW